MPEFSMAIELELINIINCVVENRNSCNILDGLVIPHCIWCLGKAMWSLFITLLTDMLMLTFEGKVNTEFYWRISSR